MSLTPRALPLLPLRPYVYLSLHGLSGSCKLRIIKAIVLNMAFLHLKGRLPISGDIPIVVTGEVLLASNR